MSASAFTLEDLAFDCCICRDGMKDPRTAADNTVVSDLCVSAQDCCVGIDDDIVSDVRMALSAFDGVAVFVEGEGAGPDRDALIQLDVAADGGCFADDDAGAVVDAEALLNGCARIDVDASLGVGVLGKDACHRRCAVEIQDMGEAIDQNGIEAGIAGDDLALGFRCRIAVIDCLQIGERKALHFRESCEVGIRRFFRVAFELGILLEAMGQITFDAAQQEASFLTASIVKEGRIEGGDAFLKDLQHIFAIRPDAARFEVRIIQCLYFFVQFVIVHVLLLEQAGGKVTVARIRKEDDDELARIFFFLCLLDSCPECGA